VAEAGYMVYLVESAGQPARQDRLLGSFVEHDVAGLIVCAATGTPPRAFDRFLARGMPICMAVRPYPDPSLDFAGSDNYGGANLATQHLIELGHRRIAFLGGERENPVRVDRLAGYFSGLATRGIAFDPALVTESRPSLTSGVADVNQVMQLDSRPTAMLCYNDFVAMGVMHALRCVGLTPGADIAVVGFDGMPETEITHPPLSTVQLYGRKVGSDAAELLIARIGEPARPPSRRIEQATLVVRASSGKPL